MLIVIRAFILDCIVKHSILDTVLSCIVKHSILDTVLSCIACIVKHSILDTVLSSETPFRYKSIFLALDTWSD